MLKNILKYLETSTDIQKKIEIIETSIKKLANDIFINLELNFLKNKQGDVTVENNEFLSVMPLHLFLYNHLKTK